MPVSRNMVTVRYAVDDIEVAEAFYERLLKREPDRRTGEFCIAWQLEPGFSLQIEEGLVDGDAGPVRLAVPDVEVARAYLEEAFGLEPGPAGRAGDGTLVCDFSDPFGNALGFRQVSAT